MREGGSERARDEARRRERQTDFERDRFLRERESLRDREKERKGER